MSTKLIVILLILLLPQIYYLIGEGRYRSFNVGSKFFKRKTIKKEDFYEEVYITNTDGFDLFVRILSCENPKGIIQLVHGVAEHSGNYMDFAKYLNKNGYIVAVSDHRGHGKSISTTYPNGYMKRTEEIVDDEIMLAKFMKEKYKDLDYYLLGHSMGSMLARLFIRENDDLIDKLILTGTVPVNKAAGLGVFLYNFVNFYLTDKGESKLIDAIVGARGLDFISYDEENKKIKANDPLRIFNFRRGYSKTLIEINNKLDKKSSYLVKNPDLKIYNMVGEDDIITKGDEGIKSTIAYLKNLGYKNISNKVYKEMKHEILNETERETVYEDMVEVLNS